MSPSARRGRSANYTEPAVGWNDEDDHVGVTKFGVANYEGTAKLKVKAPMNRPALPAPPGPEQDEPLRLLM